MKINFEFNFKSPETNLLKGLDKIICAHLDEVENLIKTTNEMREYDSRIVLKLREAQTNLKIAQGYLEIIRDSQGKTSLTSMPGLEDLYEHYSAELDTVQAEIVKRKQKYDEVRKSIKEVANSDEIILEG